MSDTILPTLTQATSEFAFHVDKLLFVEITQFVTVDLTFLAYFPAYYLITPHRAAPRVSRILSLHALHFPQLVFALRDFMKTCIVVGEAWIAIANTSIALFSTLRSRDTMTGDDAVADQVRSVRLAIKDAGDACASLRRADIRVLLSEAAFEQLMTVVKILIGGT